MKIIDKLYASAVTFDPVKQKKTMVAMLAVMVAIVAVAPTTALAGAIANPADQDFSEIWDVMVEWTQGILGRIIALTMILVGIVMGVARQSIMAFVMGPVAGMGLFYAPDIIDGIMGASMLN